MDSFCSESAQYADIVGVLRIDDLTLLVALRTQKGENRVHLINKRLTPKLFAELETIEIGKTVLVTTAYGKLVDQKGDGMDDSNG